MPVDPCYPMAATHTHSTESQAALDEATSDAGENSASQLPPFLLAALGGTGAEVVTGGAGFK